MLNFSDDALGARISTEIGFKPSDALNAFQCFGIDVRARIARFKADPHLPHRDRVRGRAGQSNEVTVA